MRRIYTGDRPTGKLHLGHYVGTLSNRVALQSKYKIFIGVVDIHSLTDQMDDPGKTLQMEENIKNLVLDYLSVGINPDKTTILLQSAIPETRELFAILMNVATIARCERIPTLKEKIRDQKIKNPSMGLLNYPLLMASDILGVRADLVPVGKDQESHVEFAREVAHTFNRLYQPIFPEPEAIIGEAKVLPGLDGKMKMSKSLDNAIYLSDTAGEVEKKVMSMFTDPKRVSMDTPGEVKGNPVFIYHDIFNKDAAEVENLKKRYGEGRVGDVEVKKRLADVINKFLNPIRFRRNNFAKQEGLAEKTIKAGSQKTRIEVQKTLAEVKKVLNIPQY